MSTELMVLIASLAALVLASHWKQLIAVIASIGLFIFLLGLVEAANLLITLRNR